MCLGVVCISYNKYLRGAGHFVSWHGSLGGFVVLLMGVQGVIGYLTTVGNGSIGGLKRITVVRLHRYVSPSRQSPLSPFDIPKSLAHHLALLFC